MNNEEFEKYLISVEHFFILQRGLLARLLNEVRTGRYTEESAFEAYLKVQYINVKRVKL